MHYTLDRLMNGDSSLADAFAKAKQHWKTILHDLQTVSVPELAQRLTSEQSWFENHCGDDRSQGQEVMALTGLASMWTLQDGWGDNEELARKLVAAFNASYCSGEVKVYVDKAAEMLWLDTQEI